MGKSDIKLDVIRRTDPFKVPEGYFENFVPDIISKLPQRPVESPKVINLWERVKPWIYMAAMFAGVALMINYFSNRQDIVSVYASEGLKLTSSNDIEDFYHYYDDVLTDIVYDDTMAGFWSDTDENID